MRSVAERVHISRRGSIDIDIEPSKTAATGRFYPGGSLSQTMQSSTSSYISKQRRHESPMRGPDVGTSRPHYHPRTDDLRESIAATRDANALLKERLLEKTREEAVLVQRLQNARAHEATLQRQLDDERGSVKRMKEDRVGLAQRGEELRTLRDQQRSKTMALDKAIETLELQQKSVSDKLTRTLNKERKVTHRCLEQQRKCRELETALADLSNDSSRERDKLGRKAEKRTLVCRDADEVKDQTLRELQTADVQSIGLTRDVDAVSAEARKLSDELASVRASSKRLSDELSLQQELHERLKTEFERRLRDEEASNKKICERLAVATEREMLLLNDLRGVEEARSSVDRELRDKVASTIELSTRIHELDQRLRETERDLSAKGLETEEMTRLAEMLKSQREVLKAHCEKEQERLRECSKRLAHETTVADELDERLRRSTADEASNRIKLQEGEAQLVALRDALNARTDAEAAARAKLRVNRERLDELTERHRERQMELDDLGKRFSTLNDRASESSAALQRKETELKRRHREIGLARSDLQGTLDERHDEVARLEAECATSDGRVRDLKDLIEKTEERKDQDRTELGSTLSDLSETNDELKETLRELARRAELLRTDLAAADARNENAKGQMRANDDRAATEATSNEEESSALRERLRLETQSAEDLFRNVRLETQKVHALKMEFDETAQEKLTILKRTRQAKHEADDAANGLERMKQSNLENTASIRNEESSRDMLQERLDDKTDAVTKLRTSVVDAKTEAAMLKKELANAEKHEIELFETQQVDRRTIEDLSTELKSQESVHVTDAQRVKLKITALQDALAAKIDTVDRLARATRAIKSKSRYLQERLEQTEAEASQAQHIFERMIDEEHRTVANLRIELEALTREQTLLRSDALGVAETCRAMESKVDERVAEAETLGREAASKGREARKAETEVLKLIARERDMYDTVKDFEETAAELMLQEREREKTVSELRRQLTAISAENRLLKHQISEKDKAENVLMAEIEAKRLGVTDTLPGGTGRGSSDKHAREKAKAEQKAESALHKLVHELNDAKLY